MKINELIHSESGIGFVKIRMFLESVDKEVAKENPLALKVQESLDIIVKVLTRATEEKL